jgi:hypothetical protein
MYIFQKPVLENRLHPKDKSSLAATTSWCICHQSMEEDEGEEMLQYSSGFCQFIWFHWQPSGFPQLQRVQLSLSQFERWDF